jgi:hypothetical protein
MPFVPRPKTNGGAPSFPVVGKGGTNKSKGAVAVVLPSNNHNGAAPSFPVVGKGGTNKSNEVVALEPHHHLTNPPLKISNHLSPSVNRRPTNLLKPHGRIKASEAGLER